MSAPLQEALASEYRSRWFDQFSIVLQRAHAYAESRGTCSCHNEHDLLCREVLWLYRLEQDWTIFALDTPPVVLSCELHELHTAAIQCIRYLLAPDLALASQDHNEYTVQSIKSMKRFFDEAIPGWIGQPSIPSKE